MTAQLGLFDEPDRPPVRPVTLADQARSQRVTFTAYHPKTWIPCDHCKQVQAKDPQAPPARKAKHRVRLGNGQVLVLCEPHKGLVHDAYEKAQKRGEA